MRKFLPIIFGFLIVVVIGGLGYFGYRLYGGGSGTITVWTIDGNQDELKKVGEIFHAKYPAFRVAIVPINAQVYEFKTLYALATQKETKGVVPPDVWIIPNDWLSIEKNWSPPLTVPLITV